jgi:hypothetical protein
MHSFGNILYFFIPFSFSPLANIEKLRDLLEVTNNYIGLGESEFMEYDKNDYT